MVSVSAPTSVATDEDFCISVELDNASPRLVASYMPFPVHISYHWLSADRSIVVRFEGERTEVVPALAPSGHGWYSAGVRSCALPGTYCLRVTLVQEYVAWFESVGAGQFFDVDVLVR